MAEAFLLAFAPAYLQGLFSRLTDVLITELKKLKNVNEAVQKLETTILRAQERLRKVDLSLYQGDDMLMQVLRRQISILTTHCYDADDIMDEIVLLIAKHHSECENAWEPRNVIMQSIRKWTVPHAIYKLQQKMNDILEQLNTLTTMMMPTNECTLKFDGPLIQAHNHMNQMSIVGRDNDVRAIAEYLISCGSNGGVSIIGMVGLGKTALAQTIMNDAMIVSEFSIRVWVDVLKGCFNKEDSINMLVNHSSFNEEFQPMFGAEDSSGIDLVLKQRRNLIIFDNLLEVKYLDWDDFCSAVKNVGETKFLVTTRDPRISKLTGTTPYHLKSLSDELCKSVIMNKASSHNHEIIVRPTFLQVADALASKCEGLPLVARIIGLVLATRDEDEWNFLFNEDLWEWKAFKEEIFPLLNSCYEDMRSEMKNCFAFFSLFPKNHQFTLDDIVQLWVGAGFIHQASRFEQIGRTRLNYLLGKSIIQLCDDMYHIEKGRFELHKFNQKFAYLAAAKTCFRIDEGVSSLTSLSDDIRHISLIRDYIPPKFWSQMKGLKRLSTILSLYANHRRGHLGKIPPNIFKYLERLRILALCYTDIAELPNTIDSLKHLRYLDISNTPINCLPDTLSKVYSLQILKFSNTRLSCLPKNLQNLPNLLFVDWNAEIIGRLGLPCNIGNLSSLRNLPLFSVGKKDGRRITELKNLNNLQGSIVIKDLDNVRDWEEAKSALLCKKAALRKLELHWNSTGKDKISGLIMDNLKPPNLLRKLKITSYGFYVFPSWISHPFPFLEKIHLTKCHACTIFPGLGKLPNLKVLILEEMDSLKIIDTSMHGTSTEHFRSLEVFVLKNMAVLQMWKGSEMSSMLKLRELNFKNCPILVDIPPLENFTSLECVRIIYCPSLKALSELPNSLKLVII